MAERRGFTLVEILVAAGLLLLLLGLLGAVLVPALRIWADSRRDSEAQQAAAVVVARVRDEVRAAHPDSIACLESPQPSLLLLSWKDRDGYPQWSSHGEFLWQKRVFLYLEADRREVRLQERPLPSPGAEVTPLRVLSFTPSADDRVLARGVRRLEFSRRPATGAVFLTVETEVDDRRSLLEASAAPVLASEEPPAPAP